MRTTDRAGNTLNRGAVDEQFDTGRFDTLWAIRVVDQQGDLLNATNWKRHEVPGDAVLERSRHGGIEEPSWRLSLTILADALPSTVPLKQLHRIEIDRIHGVGQPNHWPYFTGIIDDVDIGWEQRDGAIVKILTVTASGVLKRADDYWIDRVNVTPAFTSYSGYLVGMCVKRRFKMDCTGEGASGTHPVPASLTYAVTSQIVVSENADMSSPKTRGDGVNGYTIAAGSPAPGTITWGSAYDPPDTMYCEVPIPVRFGVHVDSTWATDFYVLNYGREPDDLYHTEVSSYTTSGGNGIVTPKDPTVFRSGNSLLGSDERLTLTDSDGTESIVPILSLDANGVITLDGLPSFTPVAGDPIRLSTTEVYPVWRNNATAEIVYYKNSGMTTRHKRGAFKTMAQAGLAIPTLPYNFTGGVSDRVYATVNHIDLTNTANRLENVVETLITSSVKLYPGADVTPTWSGAWVKNLTLTDLTMGDVLREFKQKAFPPNVYVHDHEDGTITIKPYRQASTPQWTLQGAVSIHEDVPPEPVTAVVVLSQDDADPREENKAPLWYFGHTNATNPHFAVDGSLKEPVTTGSTSVTLRFRIPLQTPKECYPFIKEVRVSGRGFVTLYSIRDPESAATTTYHSDLSRLPCGTSDGTNTAPSTLTISGDRLWSLLNATTANDLLVVMEEDDTGGSTVSPTITEIEIVVNNLVAWKAALTDDSSADATYGAAPSGWTPTDTETFGSIWWQPNSATRESYRFCPTSYLKRVAVIYDSTGTNPPAKARANQRHRTATITLSGIGQQDARDIAERYADEYLRISRQYKVVAPLYEPAELGDTVTVPAPPGQQFEDGSAVKDLMLWDLGDSGSPYDVMATYTFVDYSA